MVLIRFKLQTSKPVFSSQKINAMKINAPRCKLLYIQNGEDRTICIADEAGAFSPVQGKTLACARQCCLFFSQEQN